MASANIPQSEEQFLCPICLDTFTQPVSTPCGHTYCKDCITSHWASSDFHQCPLCKEKFGIVPELRVNTEIRDVCERFKRTRVAGDEAEVPCDLCRGTKRKALKSCLVCMASYCSAHLEPHHTVHALKWHELINPVETLEDRVCKKHNKVMEFFCREDQSCVCTVCLREDHVMHHAVSLEDEFKEKKTKLRLADRQVKHVLSEKCNMARRIENSKTQGWQAVEEVKAETVKAFDALVASIVTRKVKLIELLEEKQKAAEQQAEALIGQLQLEITENRRTSAKLEELSKTEDDFRLLQDIPSVSSPSNTPHRLTATAQSLLQVETVRSAVAKIEETLSEQMEIIIEEVNQVDKEGAGEEQTQIQTGSVFDDELGKIQEQCAVKVTLDPNTAHPSLIVSEDRKQVRDGGTRGTVPDSPARFDSLHFVLGSEGFSSGRFYYEVALKGQMGWEVGVARESISRKGDGLSLSPGNGCWTLGSYTGRVQANANPPVMLPTINKLLKVGVFVDYEGGLVSFYDVDTRDLIYSFTGCAFTTSGPFLSYLVSFRLSAKTRIYPLFRPSGSAPLEIAPVRCTKRH